MRSVLLALTDELKRLKAAGVTTVAVSDESLAALRKLVAECRAAAGEPEAGSQRSEASGQTSAIRGQESVVAEQSSEVSLPAEALGRRREVGDQKPAVSGQRSEVGGQSAEAGDQAPAPPPVSEVVLPPGTKAERWQALRELVLNHPVCRAHVRPGKQVVFGVGSLEARILFVGEAPGAEEEEQGEPFVGPAGQLLTRMIQAMGVQRGDVYIGNIMNWRPEKPLRADGTQVGNRQPTAEEMAVCLPFITAQIEVVDPALIVALGATAAHGLLGQHAFRTLHEVRGRWHDYRGRPLRVTYHPSYLLRKEADGRVSANRAKRAAWEDLLAVMERAGLPISDKQRGYFLK